MRMLRSLMVAAALLGGSADAATAQTNYFGLLGGYNLAQDSDWDFSGSVFPVEHEPGYALGAFAGGQTDSGLRYEGELTLRTNNVDTVGGSLIEGQVDKLSLMVNFIYELGFGGGGYRYGMGGGEIRPYLGVGGGGVLVHISDVNSLAVPPAVNDSEYGLAYQFIGGVGFELSAESTLYVDYRYFATDKIGFTDTGNNPFDAEFVDWTVTVGLRTNF